MLELQIIGSVTSKIAFHVPVFRKWKLVWERRDFGTRTDMISEVIPLGVKGYTDLPDGGLDIKIWKDVGIRINRVRGGSQGELKFGVSLSYGGFVVPGTYQIINVPVPGELKVFGIAGSPYKGVKADVTATLYVAP